jgi:hypothetical protein
VRGRASVQDASSRGIGVCDFPTVQDGARGGHFIHKAVESNRARAWVDASYSPPS